MVTSSRSWYHKNNIGLQRLCCVKHENHWGHILVAQKRYTVREIPAAKQFTAWKKIEAPESVFWAGKQKNSIVTPRKNATLPFICIPTKTKWLVEVRSSRGYRSVVDLSGGVQEVSGSNLGVPQHFVLRKMFRSVHQDNCWRRMKN